MLYRNKSINAANSMAEEYSKYMESAEAHITIFKEKLVETYSTFMSGDCAPIGVYWNSL